MTRNPNDRVGEKRKKINFKNMPTFKDRLRLCFKTVENSLDRVNWKLKRHEKTFL